LPGETETPLRTEARRVVAQVRARCLGVNLGSPESYR
jgi:hypothetical protein